MIEPILMIITVIWVLIGATLIMPYCANRKITREGGRIDRLERGFHQRLNGIERLIPKDIPTMGKIQAKIEAGRKETAKELVNFQHSIPSLIIQTVQTKEFASAVKSYEGRMYRAKGIDMAEAQKGIDAAQQIFLEKVENQDPNHENRNELMLIIRDTIKTAEKAELIEEGSTDQKMGVIQGIIGIYDRLQKRVNNGSLPASPRGGFLPSPPQPRSGGSELDTYFR